MSPRLFTDPAYGSLGWPWPLRSTFESIEKEIAGDHHLAPVKVADLLRVKSWLFAVEYDDGAGDVLSLSQVVTQGTIHETFSGVVTEHNDPGWTTNNDAVQRTTHPATVGDFTSDTIAGMTYYDFRADVPEEFFNRERNIGIYLRLPRLDFIDADPEQPAWVLPVFLLGEIIDTDVSYPESPYVTSEASGLIYLGGDELGTPSEGWTIEISVSEYFT